MIPGHPGKEQGNGGAAQLRSGAPAAPESRLVIRDETSSEETLASHESSGAGFVSDYESEIYRLESRGRRGVIIAYPVALESANPRIAHIDWCAFTLKPPVGETYLWIERELERLFGFDDITPRATGLYGYKQSAIIEEGGLMAWGGKNQRGTVYVSLNAQGCARVTDWGLLRGWCECHGARLTRVDLAHDELRGKDRHDRADARMV